MMKKRMTNIMMVICMLVVSLMLVDPICSVAADTTVAGDATTEEGTTEEGTTGTEDSTTEEETEIKTGFYKENGKTYYYNSKGEKVTNKFVTVKSKKYYFDKNGVMAASKFATVKGKKYYFDKNGVMAAGKFVTVKGKKYYFDKNGVMAANKSVTIKNKKYFFDKDGVVAINRFATIKNKTYYFDKNGVKVTGWMKKGNNYYYLNRSTGVQTKNGTVNGIKIKDGKAVKTEYNVYKIKTMIKARTIMKNNTKTTDSKSQKLRKMFEWVKAGHYKQYRILPLARQKKGWEMTFANDHFDSSNEKVRYGCCVSDACAFAFLATECGYTAYVADDTEHGWTEINGRVYDPLFVTRSNGYARFYGATYAKANSGRETLNPRNRTKI